METVFSDPEGAKVAFLREARSKGYVVFLVFIGLDSSELLLPSRRGLAAAVGIPLAVSAVSSYVPV